MNKLLFLCISLLLILNSSAQTRAVTSNGDEVILNADGTWQYVNKDLEKSAKVDTSKINFTKSLTASFLVKSSKINYGVYIDPKKWTFKKSASGEVSEFEFDLKDKDAYAMFISEKIEVPLATLKVIAIENAKSVGPDMVIVKEEYRKVNGNLILYLQMEGSIQGIRIAYRGYYYSSTGGTVQLITYTSTNLSSEYKAEIDDFLNGFVTFEK